MGSCRAHGEMKVKINTARSVQPMSPRFGGIPKDAIAVLDAFHVVKVRHEALCVSSGGERPPPPCCRSSAVKLGAA